MSDIVLRRLARELIIRKGYTPTEVAKFRTQAIAGMQDAGIWDSKTLDDLFGDRESRLDIHIDARASTCLNQEVDSFCKTMEAKKEDGTLTLEEAVQGLKKCHEFLYHGVNCYWIRAMLGNFVRQFEQQDISISQ